MNIRLLALALASVALGPLAGCSAEAAAPDEEDSAAESLSRSAIVSRYIDARSPKVGQCNLPAICDLNKFVFDQNELEQVASIAQSFEVANRDLARRPLSVGEAAVVAKKTFNCSADACALKSLKFISAPSGTSLAAALVGEDTRAAQLADLIDKAASGAQVFLGWAEEGNDGPEWKSRTLSIVNGSSGQVITLVSAKELPLR